MKKIRYFELCSGIGAFHSAFDIVGGFKCVGWCEFDPVPQLAYRTLYNTKNEVFFNDARTLNPADIPPFDILVGGIPCQSWSAAGLRKGFADERGQLFFDFARILEARKPPLFIIENVPALLSADSGNAYHTILSKIHELGYHAEWQIIDGSAYLPQARKRVFLVGYLDERCAREIFPIGIESKKAVSELTDHAPQGARVYGSDKSAITQTASSGGGHGGFYFVDMNDNSKTTDIARCITARQDSGISKHKGEHSAVFFDYNGVYPIINPDRETVRQNGRRVKNDGEPAFCCTLQDRHGIIHKGRIRRLHPKEVWRLFGFRDEQYETVAKAVNYSDAKLYKLAGNSIMVPVLVDVLTRIKEVFYKYNLFESGENE